MSMVGNFLLVSDDEIAALLAAPDTVHELLDRRVYEAELPADYVDVDKTWHALHFLLTESAWDGTPPLHFIAAAGEPVGEVDVGYGPARALRAHEVTALDHVLERIDFSALLERFTARGWTRSRSTSPPDGPIAIHRRTTTSRTSHEHTKTFAPSYKREHRAGVAY